MHVPLLAWGPGVEAGRYDTPVSPLAIAKTVGRLFGFQVGEPDVEPFAPVLGRQALPKKPEKAAAAR